MKQTRPDPGLHLFFGRCAAMLNAGVPIDSAIAGAMDSLTESSRASARDCIVRMGAGVPFSKAMWESGLLARDDTDLIRAGEQTGSLGAACQKMSSRCRRREERSKRLRQRLVLPAFLLMAVIVILPVPDVFSGRESALFYVFRIMAVALLIWWLGVRIGTVSASPSRWRWTRVPFLGGHVQRLILLDVFQSLDDQYRAGIPVQQCLLNAALETRGALASELRQAAARTGAGDSLMTALTGVRSLTHELRELLRAGEMSGTVDDALTRCTALLADQVHRTEQAIALWVPRLVYWVVLVFVGWQIVGSYLSLLP